MRQKLAFLIVTALATSPMPAQLAAQHGEQRGSPRAGLGGSPRGELRSALPQPPMRSEPGRGVITEPGHPAAQVPYVRDNHWYGHATPNDARFRLPQPFRFGRFGQVGPSHVFRVARTDLATRRVWLPGGGFEIAASEWNVTTPWCWTCDDFVVYDDPDHPGWYLLYDSRMGEYVHAQFIGA